MPSPRISSPDILLGINLEFARLLINRGANVLFADLALRPEAQELVSAHQAGHGPRAFFQKTDVTNWDQLSNLFTVGQKEFGGVDIVCPGAGVYEPPFSSFWHPPGSPGSKDDPAGGRYATLDINLTHPIRMTQLAISHFLAASPPVSPSNPKSIVHISSIAGQATPIVAPMYNATKHAINGFVRSLGPLEANMGIRVAAVAPGVVKTPLWTDNQEKLKAVGGEDQWVTPEEVAVVMLALVEDDSVDDRRLIDGEEGQKVPIRGGSILEVSKGHVRDVQAYMDPGPGHREGNTASNMEELVKEVYGLLGHNGWGQPAKVL